MAFGKSGILKVSRKQLNAFYEARTSINYLKWTFYPGIKNILHVEDRVLKAINIILETELEFSY